MARYPHFITRSSAGKWPDLVICVDCVTDSVSIDDRGTRRHESLYSWHYTSLVQRDGNYIFDARYCGGVLNGFWSVIESVANHYNYILILSYQCGRIWPLLDFWGRLESGYVNVCWQGHRRNAKLDSSVQAVRKKLSDPLGAVSSGFVSRLLDRDMGLLVCEDTPNIASFGITGTKARCLWIDTQNHGCTSLDGYAPGNARSSAIAGWYKEYSSVLRRYNLGAIRATGGSQAFHGWRHHYLKGSIYVHTHKRATDIESRSYHGGRCEAFRLGAIKDTLYYIDVRSMYPSICTIHRLPARLRSVDPGGSTALYQEWSRQFGVIADVSIATDEAAYPLTRGGCTLWPTGRFRTSLAGPELHDCVSRQRVIAWHGMACYDLEPCLREYAHALYAARCEAEASGNKNVADSIKKLLVSLPGKFAQRMRSWVNTPAVTSDVWWGQWWGRDANDNPCRYRSLGGLVQQDRDMGWGGETVPAIASWITSAGRMKLLEAIRIAGWDNVYYCDTDALILSEAGYGLLQRSGYIAQGILGQWQLKEIITSGHISGVKHYVANGRMVCAGLPKGSHTDYGDGKHYWHSPSPAIQCENGLRPTADSVLRRYERFGEYRHGIVGADGRVTPFHIEED